mgnify:CR=1
MNVNQASPCDQEEIDASFGNCRSTVILKITSMFGAEIKHFINAKS